MTLNGKKEKASKSKVKARYLMPTENGILYTPTGELWEYPIFVGEQVVYPIGPEPLRIEFLHEGKGWVFIFYDKKLGMVAKAKIPRRQATYVLQEILSRKGQIPKDGLINRDLLDKILGSSKIYTL